MPGEFHGQKSLVGYSPWGRKESDTTEELNIHTQFEENKVEHYSREFPYVIQIEIKFGRGYTFYFFHPFLSTYFVFSGQGIYCVIQLLKNLRAMQETPVQFLGEEDILEKG